MIVAIPPTIKGLNPFENQVYFYLRNHQWEDSPRSLNPFENQVYFYRKDAQSAEQPATDDVLIPLRIRSISTVLHVSEEWPQLYRRLNPFENQVYFYFWTSPHIPQTTKNNVLIPLRIRSISTYWVVNNNGSLDIAS